MWRSDSSLSGPERASLGDIENLNRLFSEAFTERYRRDGLSGVRVPYLNPVIWQFAIEASGDGAMVWRDGRGELVAFNMVHQSGNEGWMGPLAVRTDRQGRGHGRRIVQSGIDWLQARQVRTIGVETMPRTIDNIGFYSRLGFVPEFFTVTLQREHPPGGDAAGTSLSSVEGAPRAAAIRACADLAARFNNGADYTRELELTLQHHLGDVTLLGPVDAPTGFALWHAVPLALGRSRDELRVLKLVAASSEDARKVVRAVESSAAAAHLQRVAIRCQTSYRELYSGLISDGYRVHWTDLRMTLGERQTAAPNTVVLSNWEI